MIKISNGHRALKNINSRRGRGKWYLPCFQSPFLDIRPFLRRSTKKALSFLTELLLWRREGDSNPRDGIRRQHDFQSCTLNRSDTSPSASFCLTRSIIISSVFDNVNTFSQLFSRFFILFSIFACFSFIYRHFKLLFSCFFSFKIQINIVFLWL